MFHNAFDRKYKAKLYYFPEKVRIIKIATNLYHYKNALNLRFSLNFFYCDLPHKSGTNLVIIIFPVSVFRNYGGFLICHMQQRLHIWPFSFKTVPKKQSVPVFFLKHRETQRIIKQIRVWIISIMKYLEVNKSVIR